MNHTKMEESHKYGTNETRHKIIHTTQFHLYGVPNQAKLINDVRSRNGYPRGKIEIGHTHDIGVLVILSF